MSLTVTTLELDQKSDYQEFLSKVPNAMFYHTIKFRQFLAKICSNIKFEYILLYENQKLVAALPLVVKLGSVGSVINSLPFFGSHGGILSINELKDDHFHKVHKKFIQLVKDHNAVCSTIIEPPKLLNDKFYSFLAARYLDKRIGQITHLPEITANQDYNNAVFDLIHSKTRNSVRKGYKSGYELSHDGSLETFKTLFKLHESNIKGMGGISKSWKVFSAIKEIFKYDRDYRIYTASQNGEVVSAMLIFYYKDFVEYFCPATLESHRSNNPLSALIHRGMVDSALDKGSKYWNWGGTWLSQKGVYAFKSRWGTTDYPYQYHINLFRDINFFNNLGKENLLRDYEYFYTIPFDELT